MFDLKLTPTFILFVIALKLNYISSKRGEVYNVVMTIKQVSEKYGISSDTLRYYEKAGIIMPVTRKNGIRQYGEKEIANIEFALCMRSAGLSVTTIAEYMRLIDLGDSTAEQRRQLLIAERDNLKQKMEQMSAALDKLNYKIDEYYKQMLNAEKQLKNKKGE